jgi:hypothetical protein
MGETFSRTLEYRRRRQSTLTSRISPMSHVPILPCKRATQFVSQESYVSLPRQQVLTYHLSHPIYFVLSALCVLSMFCRLSSFVMVSWQSFKSSTTNDNCNTWDMTTASVSLYLVGLIVCRGEWSFLFLFVITLSNLSKDYCLVNNIAGKTQPFFLLILKCDMTEISGDDRRLDRLVWQ